MAKSDTEYTSWTVMENGTDDNASQEAAKPLWAEVMQYLAGAPDRQVMSGRFFETTTAYGGKCSASSAVMTIKEGEKDNLYAWMAKRSSDVVKLGMASFLLVEHNDTTFETVAFYPSLEVAEKNAEAFKKYVGEIAGMLAAAPERNVYADATASHGHDALCFYLEQTFKSADDATKSVAFARKMNADNQDDAISMSFLDGNVLKSFYAFEPHFWMNWNANMARYMNEMMGGMGMAVSNKCTFGGKATPAVRAALEQWKMAPNFEVIEADLVAGFNAFRMGFFERPGVGYINECTLKAGQMDAFKELSKALPAMGFTGNEFAYTFVAGENKVMQIGADTLEGWKAQQVSYQTDPKMKELMANWIGMLENVKCNAFGKYDDEAQAMLDGWAAAPFCDMNVVKESFQPARVNY